MAHSYSLNLRGVSSIMLLQRDGKLPRYVQRYTVAIPATIRIARPFFATTIKDGHEMTTVVAKIVTGPEQYTKHEHFIDCTESAVRKLLHTHRVPFPAGAESS